MPEFDSLAMVVLAIAIVGIIIVTAKSRLTSNNVTLNNGGKITMSNNIYKLAMLGIVAIIVFGGYMAISGYNTEIYPLDRIRGNLDGIISSSDPNVIRDHLVAIQTDLDVVMVNIPDTVDANGKLIAKNPVWIFSTESTNFLRIQNNIDTMITSVNYISSISKDNSAYHTAMLDLNDRSLMLELNIVDATPYMYVSPENMMMSVVWVAVVIGIIILLKRKKEQLQKIDDIGV
ncbi:MAG: PEFG-CTERM sorting domain-containing protein [Nitrosopumilus sp.]|jgi:predicted secreted protein with PEFG-CTERM motif